MQLTVYARNAQGLSAVAVLVVKTHQDLCLVGDLNRQLPRGGQYDAPDRPTGNVQAQIGIEQPLEGRQQKGEGLPAAGFGTRENRASVQCGDIGFGLDAGHGLQAEAFLQGLPRVRMHVGAIGKPDARQQGRVPEGLFVPAAADFVLAVFVFVCIRAMVGHLAVFAAAG